MIEFTTFIQLLVASFFLNNIISTYFIGIETLSKLEHKIENVFKNTIALLLVLPFVSVMSYLIYHELLLEMNDLGETLRDYTYFQTLLYVFIIIVISLIVTLLIQKVFPKLHHYLGSSLKHITTNTAVLGILLLNILSVGSVVESFIFAVMMTLGYGFVLLIVTYIEKQLENAPIPSNFKGLPLQFIILAIIALIFSGFGN